MKKTCRECSIEKDITEYYKNKLQKDGHTNICKPCKSIKDKLYHKTYTITEESRKKNKIRRNTDEYKERRKKYLLENKERISESNKNYKLNNRDKILQQKKDYYNRKKKDPLFVIKKRLRKRTYAAFRVNKWYKKCNTHILLGCDYKEAYKHIENLFTDDMSWDKLGLIHIDHIIPLDSANTEEELIKLCHYTNLQPLWAEDNLKKSNKF